MEKGFAPILFIGLIVIAIASGAFVYYFQQKSKIPWPATISLPSPSSIDDISNWKTYRNEKVGFEIKYPPNFTYWLGDPENSIIIGQQKSDKNIFIQYPAEEGYGKNCSDVIRNVISFRRCENTYGVGGFMTDNGIENWTEKNITYITKHEGKDFVIRFSAEEHQDNLFRMFENMVSTLAFYPGTSELIENSPSPQALLKPPTACIQVIQPAINQTTGECKQFSTPCDVPEGWTKVSQCPAASCPKPPNCMGTTPGSSRLMIGDPNPSDPNQCPRYSCSQ